MSSSSACATRPASTGSKSSTASWWACCRPKHWWTSVATTFALVDWTRLPYSKRDCSKTRWAPPARNEGRGCLAQPAGHRPRTSPQPAHSLGLAARRRRRALDADGFRRPGRLAADHAQEPDLRVGLGAVRHGRELRVVWCVPCL